MRVLVTWGSKLGGTEAIARTIGDELGRAGFDVVLEPAARVRSVQGYEAAIIGGALYANRWHKDAHRLVTGNITALRRIPIWLFSSGPLDESADHDAIPATVEVSVLGERVGALGHATFGGRLPADARGFPAAAMAKKLSGDWRNPDHIRAWAGEIAHTLPNARLGKAIDPPARSIWRLTAYGVAGWALCALAMGGLLQIAPTWFAITIHAVAAPLIFAALSLSYFRARGAREPLPTALAFTAVVAILDAAVVAGLVLRDFTMLTSVAGTWLPFLLIFLATWATGSIKSMIPERRAPRDAAPA